MSTLISGRGITRAQVSVGGAVGVHGRDTVEGLEGRSDVTSK